MSSVTIVRDTVILQEIVRKKEEKDNIKVEDTEVEEVEEEDIREVITKELSATIVKDSDISPEIVRMPDRIIDRKENVTIVEN